MSSHRGTSRRRRVQRSGRVRAVLCLGLVVGIGSTGTLAMWTDDATLQSGSIQAGSFDLQLANSAGTGVSDGAAGAPFAFNDLAVANMIPTESYAAVFQVKNNGTTPFTYTIAGTATNGDAGKDVAAKMKYTVYRASATTANTGVAGNTAGTNGLRTGTCGTGFGPALATDVVLSGTSSSLGSVTTALGAAGADKICVQVKFDASAATTLQGGSTVATLKVSATQVVNP
jgi:predicted ribosomally synthesized peptide with SipW-like signal peptide